MAKKKTQQKEVKKSDAITVYKAFNKDWTW